MHFLLTLILQIAVILLAARAVGWLFRRLNQPQVVGEMAAGILLGPSLLGWLAPAASAALFPPESLGYLNTLSQVGLLFFMFLVGLEFDPRLLRGRGHAAVVISHVSIVVPFFLGAVLALFLYPRLSDGSVSFTGFALFMGAAMSITAFPVLARILTERNLLQTRVGAITIACAAVDDITAWTILAVVVAIVRSSAADTPLWLTLAGTSVYLVLMVLVVRRALGWLESFYHSRGRLTQDMVAAVLLLVLASAWTTEWLGIHALFGAFALGAVMPKDPGFVHDLSEKLEDITVVFLLPLFFAFTGLRTSIGLVSGTEMWMYAGLCLLVATAGKFGGSTIAARLTALSWREAGALGILMNTRGLMELVILTIGLELGVISPALFTMMVLMALTTTAMTTPILEWLYPARLIRESASREDVEMHEHTVLLPISLSSSGPGLLRAALALAPEGRQTRVYALHLQRTSDHGLSRVDVAELPAQNEVLRPLLAEAEAEGVEVRPLSFTSRNVDRDILDVAHVKRADLVLMGWHKPVLGRSILSGTVAAVLRHARVDVAVLVERGAAPWRRILVPYRNPTEDLGALELARRIATNREAEVTILHVVAPDRASDGEGRLSSRWEEHAFPDGVRLKLVESDKPLEAAVREAREGYDLIVVGVSRAWGTTPTPFGRRHEALVRASAASLLVVRRYDARAAARSQDALEDALEPKPSAVAPPRQILAGSTHGRT
jgi:Kef-type K+ transport system membrane component KefB/nucleotide-binding universal stress UspA family protein